MSRATGPAAGSPAGRTAADRTTAPQTAYASAPQAAYAGAPQAAYAAAATVPDPELRVVTVADLGILRSVTTDGDRAEVVVTPTYSGCPAMAVIRQEIAEAVRAAGWREVTVHTRLSPPWSTDWITDTGRARLAAAGIAPPGPAAHGTAGQSPVVLGLPTVRPPAPACPHCGSGDTAELSRFGATACKALWRCHDCGEPFEHLKAI